LKIKYVREE